MNRKLYSSLLDWKNKKNRKPLILKGARQSGKTWLLKEFGKNEYENTAYINCHHNPQAEEIFRSDFNMERIIRSISALTDKDIYPEKTLIILDEIQEIPNAIASLKYFCEDAGEYHVAVAGSLLGLAIHSGVSFPVGKVNHLTLYPLDFEEYLEAKSGIQTIDFLKKEKLEDLQHLHEKLIEHLREYYFTGGMPDVVSSFLSGAQLREVREVQNQILSDYADDMSKHADDKIVTKIHQVWNSIPQQLAKDNYKFLYGDIKKGARAGDFELAIQWLVDAGVIYKIPRVNKVVVPLKFYEDFSGFKLYPLDCGLMGAMVDAPASEILIGNNIFTESKGAFTEQFVLQQLLSNGIESIYYYYANNSRQELDYVFQLDNKIVPVEVKAEDNLKSKSLKQFITDNPDYRGIRISMSGYRVQDWMTNLPLYAISRIRDAVTDI